jgi:hypothetical protein
MLSIRELLEHVIHSQIMDHFDRWNILTDKQRGLRRRRSCESQLIITIDVLAKLNDITFLRMELHLPGFFPLL